RRGPATVSVRHPRAWRRGITHLDAAVHVRLDLGARQGAVVDTNVVQKAAPALEAAAAATRLAEDQGLRVGGRRSDGLGLRRYGGPVEIERVGVRAVIEDRGEVRPLVHGNRRCGALV